jgi:hypothetical protein
VKPLQKTINLFPAYRTFILLFLPSFNMPIQKSISGLSISTTNNRDLNLKSDLSLHSLHTNSRRKTLQPNLTIPTDSSTNYDSSLQNVSNLKYSSLLSSTSINTNISNPTSDKNIIELLEASALKNKGSFSCVNIQWAFGNDSNSAIVSTKTILNNSFHWKYANMNITPDGKIMTGNSLLIASNIQECEISVFESDFIVKLIIPSSNKSYFFKFANFNQYIDFIASSMIWHNLKQSSLVPKWNYYDSVVFNKDFKKTNPIICKFEIYGPIPSSHKDIINFVSNSANNPIYPTPSGSPIQEGWFSVIGELLPTGILNLYTEANTLIYSLNITTLFSSEVRILHHSILQDSNVLFLGFINGLREGHHLSNSTFFILDNKLNKVNRILIRFNSKIDIETWFVLLSSYTKLEYVGNEYLETQLKVIKSLSLEIMEAQFVKNLEYLKASYLYCELVMWNTSWFRSAIVKTDDNLITFWKELLDLILPISTNENFKIIIKRSNSSDTYNFDGENSDEIIGSCFLHPSLFAEKLFLQRIPILNLQNKSIGELMINSNLDTTEILPTSNYKTFEKMILNSKIQGVIEFLEPKSVTSNLESWSTMLLDLYQSLNREEEYLETLMKYELSSNAIINNSDDTPVSVQQRKIFKYNTIFRGNSILSKSLEKYTLRVGHEYLEKLLGDFIEKIEFEDLNCECDPKVDPENYKSNYKNLLKYIEYLWDRIYKTTNDIPSSIKCQWKNLRTNVELSVDLKDKDIPLNALSSFIFLRFICPAILSPKLYNLSTIHYSGKVSRTLVLLAKVLMTFSNRSLFQQHKDSYLMDLNDDFILKHNEEILIYFDKVTFRKMDFTEKILDISNDSKNPEIYKSDVLSGLPTIPYLIDKYLNIAKFAKILDSLSSMHTEENESKDLSDLDSYQIEGFDDTGFDEDFLTSLIKEDNEAFSSLLSKHEFSFKELQSQAVILSKKTRKIVGLLELPETPNLYINSKTMNRLVSSMIRSLILSNESGFERVLTFNVEIYHNNLIRVSKENHKQIEVFFNEVIKEGLKQKNKPLPSSTSISRSINTSVQNIPISSEITESKDSNKKRSLFKNIFHRKSIIH